MRWPMHMVVWDALLRLTLEFVHGIAMRQMFLPPLHSKCWMIPSRLLSKHPKGSSQHFLRGQVLLAGCFSTRSTPCVSKALSMHRVFIRFSMFTYVWNRARILLHDPHCQLDKADDISTQKCLLASRVLLNLTYQLQSSSVDFKLLPPTFVVSPLMHYALIESPSKVTLS